MPKEYTRAYIKEQATVEKWHDPDPQAPHQRAPDEVVQSSQAWYVAPVVGGIPILEEMEAITDPDIIAQLERGEIPDATSESGP